ncbi:EAL domain-containing protein [Novosphingobium lentum]|uniref:EAL domain-containing protein n=1 Tax=Novosphingobium lentum TaxID=145287 RepID=UPI000837486E|nr:EAL domain-containing protein [Novosphingobium lentum]
MSRPSFLKFLPTKAAASLPGPAPAPVGGLEISLFENFENSNKGWFWATDSVGNLTYLSDSVASLFGDIGDRVLGTPFADLFAPSENAVSARDRLPFVLSRHSSFEKLTLRTVNPGEQRWWEVSGRAQMDADRHFRGYLGYAVDVTEQLQSSQSASQLAMFDALTGLPNRLSMSRRLEESLLTLDFPGRSCAVLLVDLDRFKQVNDSLGHPAGDALLVQVSGRLLKIIGDKTKIFRLGGDEFQIILPDVKDRGELGEIAHNIIASLSQPYSVEGSRCVIGASVGLAVGPADGRTSEELMRNVDLALYSAKGSGRGCYRFFSTELLQTAEDRRVLEEDLRDALVKDELAMFYQPIVSTATNRVTGVEALIRWHHPTRGPISPALFIPIAEEANLIENLGEWILRKACDDAASWPADIRVAVNVSPIQFANEAFPRIVMSALANSGLLPARLELELTEGVFLSESTETDTMFTTLKNIGVRLALDDFGTGYSSLGYLKTAPFDKIKIDQSFVRGATLPGSRNGAIIAAIVALAGALDMETTAEGIESLDQLDLMRKLGVSHIQGWVYSKAIANDELCEQLASGNWSIPPEGPARHRSDRRSMYRKAGAILGCYYHPVLIRNLSESGALVEGLIDVPMGTQIIVDFGECQLVVATVRRLHRRGHGIEFVNPLISDGLGGLSPSHRVSPYLLSKNGLSPSTDTGASRIWDPTNAVTVEMLSNTLGLPQTSAALLDGELTHPDRQGGGPGSIGNGSGGSGSGGSGAGGSASGGSGPGARAEAIHRKVQDLFSAANPLQSLSLLNPGNYSHRQLTTDEWDRLKRAVEDSHNTQLKFIVALVVFTGARFQELLAAKWEDVNWPLQLWVIPSGKLAKGTQIRLSPPAIEVLKQLPRADDCSHMIINPKTRKPFNSVFGSWDAARKKAGLDKISIHDLRNSIIKQW